MCACVRVCAVVSDHATREGLPPAVLVCVRVCFCVGGRTAVCAWWTVAKVRGGAVLRIKQEGVG